MSSIASSIDLELGETVDMADRALGTAHDQQARDWGGSWTYFLENQLPTPVKLLGDDGASLTLAPIERRLVDVPRLQSFDRRKLGLSDQLLVEEQARTSAPVAIASGLLVWAAPIYLILLLFTDTLWVTIGLPLLVAALATAVITRLQGGWTEIWRWIKQAISLSLVALLAIGLPAIVLWYWTGLDDLARQANSLDELMSASPAFIARSLQLIFIAVASLLPGLMYFVFDREQLSTLRDRFLQQIFRFDHTLANLGDVRARYGAQLDEMFGRKRTTGARLLRGRLSPIIVATILLTLGWTLTLLNSEVVASESGDFPLLDLFQPDASVVPFAFLGAYFFAIQSVLRSYLRGDLRPKSYGNISVRLLIVVILAWVLQELIGEPAAWLRGAVFLAGIVPDTALRWIREIVRDRGPSFIKGDDSGITEPHPLSRIEGIDLYDLTRLAEEGVTNVEGLAHCDLVDLMLKTRIPAARLVDWVDQAILYLHVHGEDGKSPGNLDTNLRSFGIRTATDLERASTARPGDTERESFFKTLGGDVNSPFRVQVMLDAMADDEWLDHVRQWRTDRPASLVEINATHDALASPHEAAAVQQDRTLDLTKAASVAAGVDSSSP